MVIALQLLAPLLITFAINTKKYIKEAKIATILLILFTIVATLIFHFPPVGAEYYSFMHNVVTIGALLLIYRLLK